MSNLVPLEIRWSDRISKKHIKSWLECRKCGYLLTVIYIWSVTIKMTTSRLEQLLLAFNNIAMATRAQGSNRIRSSHCRPNDLWSESNFDFLAEFAVALLRAPIKSLEQLNCFHFINTLSSFSPAHDANVGNADSINLLAPTLVSFGLPIFIFLKTSA